MVIKPAKQSEKRACFGNQLFIQPDWCVLLFLVHVATAQTKKKTYVIYFMCLCVVFFRCRRQPSNGK